jgi:P-type Ca2+ transporter type 2C
MGGHQQDLRHGVVAAESSRSWHCTTLQEAFPLLKADSIGLSSAEVARRLLLCGPNELQAARRVSPWTILAEQFKNLLILILLGATILSLVLGHGVEALAILAIVLFAIVLGFLQEYRAERAIDALRRMAAPTATVMRDGQEHQVPARDLVPGDVVLLRSGDRVPADLRLVEAVNLQVEEASLTGESVPVEKHTDPLVDPDLPLGDRRNMAYAGTAATYGRGRGVVVATGMQTEFGRIARMLQDVETGRTPLQENLDKVGRVLARAAFVVVAIIVALGLFRGQPFMEMLIFGIALAVAVVPEALPAVVTISLAIGVQRMVKRNALMRRLAAVETLGSTSVICSDKTGTLTKDEMTARKVLAAGCSFEVTGIGYAPQGGFVVDGREVAPTPGLLRLLRAAALASDAHILEAQSQWHVKGDPTEGGLVALAAKAGLHKTQCDTLLPRVHEIPFTSERKRMTTLHRDLNGTVAFAKGAPEVILRECSQQLLERSGTLQEVPMAEEDRRAVLDEARRMAEKALRVIGVAEKVGASPADAETDMLFLGLVGMIDPPRAEAQPAVTLCRQAGIRPMMITGDHPITAMAIAREIGILRHGRVATGTEIDAMSDEDLSRQVESIDVYARVSPAHKLRVVSHLQRKGHIVAMTGDGVNDAPALKKADIGVAMGITGTDVSKEAAAMTLTDDNFASIVAAVEEGRGIFENIKKYLMYLLSSNIGEIGLMAGATLAGLPLPLSAVQILYVNLATDGLPALALAVDPPERDLMRRPPRNPRTGIFTRPVVALTVLGGIWSSLVNLGLFAWALQAGRGTAQAMTMAFVSLVLIQFFKAYSFRSDRHSVFHRTFANRWLNLAIAWELGLLGLIVSVPFLQGVFGTAGLSVSDWLMITGLAFTVVPVLEIGKRMTSRMREHQNGRD